MCSRVPWCLYSVPVCRCRAEITCSLWFSVRALKENWRVQCLSVSLCSYCVFYPPSSRSFRLNLPTAASPFTFFSPFLSCPCSLRSSLSTSRCSHLLQRAWLSIRLFLSAVYFFFLDVMIHYVFLYTLCISRIYIYTYTYIALCHARLEHFKRQTIIVFEEESVQGKCESTVFRPIKKRVSLESESYAESSSRANNYNRRSHIIQNSIDQSSFLMCL